MPAAVIFIISAGGHCDRPDDGGSSGRLRKDMNMLPPGDLRNCMVALSEDEHLLSRLFQYRFESGEGLEGHSFGNLFFAGLTAVTGDFALAVKIRRRFLRRAAICIRRQTPM